MVHGTSIAVFAGWFITTIVGVSLAHYGHLEAASVFLPMASLASFYALVFRIGRIVLNAIKRDDRNIDYADILICAIVWIFSVTNLLFMVWMWDPANAFAAIQTATTSEAWLRLNSSALFMAPGVGQGLAQAYSLHAEIVASYTTIITFFFAFCYFGAGISTVKEANIEHAAKRNQ